MQPGETVVKTEPWWLCRSKVFCIPLLTEYCLMHRVPAHHIGIQSPGNEQDVLRQTREWVISKVF